MRCLICLFSENRLRRRSNKAGGVVGYLFSLQCEAGVMETGFVANDHSAAGREIFCDDSKRRQGMFLERGLDRASEFVGFRRALQAALGGFSGDEIVHEFESFFWAIEEDHAWLFAT